MPSGEELTTLTGTDSVEEGAKWLLSMGVELVALKRGELGSRLYTKDGRFDIPAYKVTEVDPTGAGDCFDGRWCAGYDEVWSHGGDL